MPRADQGPILVVQQSVPFAPGATTIWFSPRGPTTMSAIPVGSVSTSRDA